MSEGPQSPTCLTDYPLGILDVLLPGGRLAGFVEGFGDGGFRGRSASRQVEALENFAGVLWGMDSGQNLKTSPALGTFQQQMTDFALPDMKEDHAPTVGLRRHAGP